MDRRRVTNPDIIKGKLSYLAPELTLGDPPSVSSDLFSVGVVLWEALAGRKLFTGETDVDVVLGVREADVPPLTEERPDLPAPLCAIAHQALEANPARRDCCAGWTSAPTPAPWAPPCARRSAA